MHVAAVERGDLRLVRLGGVGLVLAVAGLVLALATFAFAPFALPFARRAPVGEGAPSRTVTLEMLAAVDAALARLHPLDPVRDRAVRVARRGRPAAGRHERLQVFDWVGFHGCSDENDLARVLGLRRGDELGDRVRRVAEAGESDRAGGRRATVERLVELFGRAAVAQERAGALQVGLQVGGVRLFHFKLKVVAIAHSDVMVEHADDVLHDARVIDAQLRRDAPELLLVLLVPQFEGLGVDLAHDGFASKRLKL